MKALVSLSFPGSFARGAAGRLRSWLRTLNPATRRRALAQSLLERDPAAAGALYDKLSRSDPTHPIHWIGLGLASLGLNDQAGAVAALARAQPLVERQSRAFLALADLEERLGVGDDASLIDRLQSSIDSGQANAETWVRYLHALIREKGDDAARIVVQRNAVRLSDAMAIHGLMLVYVDLGWRRKARLLNRYLTRRWPHSDHHQSRYAFELARIGLDRQADAVLRRLYQRSPSLQTERDYGERAYVSGDFAEALRRFNWMRIRHPDDEGAYLACGYALANTAGIDAAEGHFSVALGGISNHGALVALAHMAMRRRDRPLTAARWGKVAEHYPADATAVVEQARAWFESGDAEAALDTCQAWRRRHPAHRSVDEFYAWLLMSTGRFSEAHAEAERLVQRYGPSWSAAEILVQTRGLLGRLDEGMETILQASPPVATDTDVRHLYSMLRLFELFDRAADGFQDLLPRAGVGIRLDWAWPYLAAHPGDRGGGTSNLLLKAQNDHRRLSRCVSDVVFKRWATMSRQEIAGLLDAAIRERPRVHIVNMFEQASGGSELHALDLGERLTPYAEVSFWAPEAPHPLLNAEFGVRPIDPSSGAFPNEGVLVFIGVYFSLGSWLARARPTRILVLYNTFDAVRLSAFIRTLHAFTAVKVELLFCSDMMRVECGLPGLFEPSPIDLQAFPLRPVRELGNFVIGRHSRDVPEKHHIADGEVYSALIERGARVQLLGATCMREAFPRLEALELRPAQRGGVRQYLESLDVFYYRTGTWVEPWGRVVVEAMAMGLPVVVHARGGYAEIVQDGVDGFVFQTDAEAIDKLARLQDDPELRRRIGGSGRRKVEALLDGEALRRLLAVYLLKPSTLDAALDPGETGKPVSQVSAPA